MKLKELRQIKKKTQEEVAKDLNIGRASYNRYELGLTEPDLQTLINLADYFHTTIDNLLNHSVPYLLDKSLLNEEQKSLIEEIISLDREQCLMTKAYIEGLKVGKSTREETLRKIKGE